MLLWTLYIIYFLFHDEQTKGEACVIHDCTWRWVPKYWIEAGCSVPDLQQRMFTVRMYDYATWCWIGGIDGPDSDEEGAREQHAEDVAQVQQHNGRGNITSAELSSEGDIVITEAKSKKRIKLSLHNRDNIVCAVCGEKGHTAGFIGAVYAPFSWSYAKTLRCVVVLE